MTGRAGTGPAAADVTIAPPAPPPGAPSEREGASPLRSVRMAAVLAGALAALVYANSLGNAFAYDDLHILPENPAIQSLETLPDLLMAPYWPGEYGSDLGLWRPGMIAVLGLQWAAWGGTPTMFHAVNVLAHVAATVLVVLLIARLATVPVAFLAGLVFAAHPVHVEAVANVVGLADVLSTALYLGACLLHVGRPARGYGAARLGAVGLLYLAAFSVKESAVTLPAALFLLDAARERLSFRDLPAYVRAAWPPYALLAAVAVTMLMLRHSVLGSIASPLGPLGADLLAEGVPRIWTLAQVWAHYVRLLLFPLDLAADYSPDVLPIAHGWNALAVSGAVLALGVLALALWAWRGPAMAAGRSTRRILGFGVVWFLVTISPLSNVVFLAGVLLAERTLYLPSVGFAAVAGWALVRLARERRRVAVGVAAAAVVLMGLRTWDRNPTWRNNDTVFFQLIYDYPHSGRSQWILGDLFFQQGRVSESMRAYRAAIGILGGHYQLLTEIGKKFVNAGRHDAGRRLLVKAWREHPDLTAAPTLLAVSYHQEGLWSEAERFGRAAFELNPDNAVMAHAVAGSLAEQGDLEGAVDWRKRTIALGEDEHWQQWMSLAGLHLALGDSARARAALDSALVRRGEVPSRDIVEAYRPFVPAAEVLQDSTESQDARESETSVGVQP